MTKTDTVCVPWKPIHYKSKTKTDPRFAGPALVPDLRAHNFTGENLHCW